MAGEIRRTGERLVYENSFVRVYDDDVEFGDGSLGTYVRIATKPEGSEGVVVVARHDGRYALVRTYRYPIAEFQWGFPRGFAAGEDVLETAQTEIREELGGHALSLEVIGQLTPDSGLMASRTAVVLAELAAPTVVPNDAREVSAILWVTEHELRARLTSGEITDSFTVSAYALSSIR